jgi:hypothetical protein
MIWPFRFLDRNRPSRKPRPKPPPKVRSVRPTLEILEDRMVPATFTVTKATNTGAGSGSKGDLHYCIVQVNNSTDPTNQINFAPNVTGTIDLGSNPLPPIGNPVTISGPGSNVLAVSGDNQTTPFSVFNPYGPAPTVEIDGLEIEQGNTTINGGGIRNTGTLTLKNDFLTENVAEQNGGAIYNAQGATLNLSNCTIMQNVADQNGGGIANSGALTDSGSTISGNQAGLWGGGYYSTAISPNQATANLTNTQIDANSALKGGGAYVDSRSQLIMNGGDLMGNTATGTGGGGLFVYWSSATLTNTTVGGNTASTGDGGGAYVTGNTPFVNLTINGGAISNNTAAVDGGGLSSGGGGTVVLNQNNLNQNCQVGNNTAGNNGGGMYLGGSSYTTYNGVTVQGNKATNGKGNGIYEQTGANGTLGPNGYTDKDDPGGNPVSGP